MQAATVFLILSVTLWTGGSTAPVTGYEILTQTQNQAVLLYNNATLLLNIYLEYQGLPFSGPGFSFPSWQEKGLPTASLGYRIWRCLCAGERLLLSRDSFSAIAEFFQLVLDDQLLLNSKAKDLLRLLDTARISSEAMLNNLASGLRDLGFQPPPPQPELLNWSSSGANDFQRKVRGYILCREYRDWLARVAKDMEILKRTFRGVESESQERKDCCRT